MKKLFIATLACLIFGQALPAENKTKITVEKEKVAPYSPCLQISLYEEAPDLTELQSVNNTNEYFSKYSDTKKSIRLIFYKKTPIETTFKNLQTFLKCSLPQESQETESKVQRIEIVITKESNINTAEITKIFEGIATAINQFPDLKIISLDIKSQKLKLAKIKKTIFNNSSLHPLLQKLDQLSLWLNDRTTYTYFNKEKIKKEIQKNNLKPKIVTKQTNLILGGTIITLGAICYFGYRWLSHKKTTKNTLKKSQQISLKLPVIPKSSTQHMTTVPEYFAQ